MTKERLKGLLHEMISEKTLILGVLSGPLHKGADQSLKVTIRPVTVKQQLLYQVSDHFLQKVIHRNLSGMECSQLIEERLLGEFKQGDFFTSQADYQVLIGKKQNISLLKKAPTKTSLGLSHDHKKTYLLEEGIPVPFLVELGVMTTDGKVVAKKRDKFRQINRFLEMVDDVLLHFDKNRKIHIVDFGCGKAYLTFALYHYLKGVHGYDLEIAGLDLKADVVAHCQDLADRLGYSHLKFTVGDINDHSPKGKVEMVVTLHACDTATDAALEKAVRWGADVILSVPCCQHELFAQVENASLTPLLRHGILKERFAALATDAARAQLLDILGYRTQVLEFIDMEHTPKNLLIRAVKNASEADLERSVKAYIDFRDALNVKPSLERRFSRELQLLFDKVVR